MKYNRTNSALWITVNGWLAIAMDRVSDRVSDEWAVMGAVLLCVLFTINTTRLLLAAVHEEASND